MSSEQQDLIKGLREELSVLREDFEALQVEVIRLRRALAGLRAGAGSLRERSSQEDLEDSRSSLRRSPASDSRILVIAEDTQKLNPITPTRCLEILVVSPALL